MILLGKRSVSPEGVNLETQDLGTASARSSFVKPPKVETRVKEFLRAFDFNQLEYALELVELKGAFKLSTESTLNLLQVIGRTSWRNSDIRGGSLRNAIEAFEELEATFNSEAQDKIRQHPDYPAIRKVFDQKINGLAERGPQWTKLWSKFEYETKKLLDGTICWYVGKFIDKLDIAFEPRHKSLPFVPLRSPKEVRNLVIGGMQGLEMGLTDLFPSARKKQRNS